MARSTLPRDSSSNSSTSTTKWKYDVFLSFAQEDTHSGFIDHLYDALSKHGIKVFKDDKGINKGSVIQNSLFQAIEDSLSAVVVLSKYYAFSSGCLKELQKILECHQQRVFPIFYNVDSSEVIYQTGNFGLALAMHGIRFSESKVQAWRNALSQVGKLEGWDTCSDQ